MLFVYCNCIVLFVFWQNSPLFQNLIILFTVLVCHRVRWGSLSDEPSPHLTLYKGETINFLNSTPHSIDTQTRNSTWNFNYSNFLVLLFLLLKRKFNQHLYIIELQPHNNLLCFPCFIISLECPLS